MKSQYVGDISDYRKYGLLRILSGFGKISLGVCWMLTPPDGGNDGQKLGYLHSPGKWRHYDPELFDTLSNLVKVAEKRDIVFIERSGILPNTVYQSALLLDDKSARQDYFENTRQQFADRHLVFFDADNGMEVKSKKKGTRGSAKYLYWDELDMFVQAGKSVLIFQHFCRENRQQFLHRMVESLAAKSGDPEVLAFQTAHVAFLLAGAGPLADHFAAAAQEVQQRWAGQIAVIK